MNIKLLSTFIATILAVATPAMGAVAGPFKPHRGFGNFNSPLPGHRKIPLSLPIPPIPIPLPVPVPALIRGGKKKPPTTSEGNTPPADAPATTPAADTPLADAPLADAPPAAA
ncbi:hypothetical protein K502DRAFT_339683 [Neoconidiobolus thromboides FSU 785]|nr:hypothetical protein K502DRAFT_339683 [Neoconidiobolus thromboides FSU 785]